MKIQTRSQLSKHLLALFVLPVIISCTCNTSNSSSARDSNVIKKQALSLLAAKNLHPDNSQPITQQITVGLPVHIFATMVAASQKVGLDLARHSGETVEALSFLLKEQSQAHKPIKAWFVAKEGKIVGAWLSLEGASGGVIPLDDRVQFLPAGLVSDKLLFQGIKSINVLGPWTVNNWKREIELRDPESTKKLLLLLQSSKKQNGSKSSTIEDEQYAMRLNYETGEVVLVRLTTKRGTTDTFLTFSPFEDYFVPPDVLKPYIKDILSGTKLNH